MRRLLLLALALLPGSLAAQSVTLPKEIHGGAGEWIIVAPEAVDGGTPKWRMSAGLQEVRLDLLFPPEIVDKAKGKVVRGQPGRYTIECWNAKGDVASDIAVCTVVIGNVPPVTVPPVTPPDPPDPPIDPPPAPLTGMRVLMIYESDTPIPKTVYDSMFDPRVEEYLTAKCIKGPDGKTPERRRFDEDSSLANMSPAWQALRAKLPATLPRYPEPNPSGYQVPHIAIGDSSGAVVYSGPVPIDLLELLKKYGG